MKVEQSATPEQLAALRPARTFLDRHPAGERAWKRCDNRVRHPTGKKAGAIGHPATDEMDYTAEQCEFMRAIGEYQARTGRKFPTWCEVLAVVKSLGYARRSS